MSVPRCRSCRAEIWFGLTRAGRRMPLDPHPTDAGNVVIDDTEMGLRQMGAPATDGAAGDAAPVAVRVLTKDEDPGPDVLRYISHFATCPRAARHRRKAPARG